MLWSTATSLLIHTDGLPLAVLISFAAVMGGLSIGWISIIIYKQNFERLTTKLFHQKIIAHTTSTMMTMTMISKRTHNDVVVDEENNNNNDEE